MIDGSEQRLRELKIEKLKRLKNELWRRDPLLWVQERLGENPEDFKWSEQYAQAGVNHVWDGDVDPLMKAWSSISKSYIETQELGTPSFKNIALESATGTGKTYALARIVFWFLDCFENSLVVTTAPSEAQLKLGLWSEISMLYPKIKSLRPNAQKWLFRLALEIQGDEGMTEVERVNAVQNAWHAVAFVTGTTADEVSANKARGFHRRHMLIILEECTGIPYPILTAFQNTCTGNTNYILAVGNPDNEFDTLHQFAMQSDCVNFRISAKDHPNIVFQSERYQGAVTQSSINSRTAVYGEDSQLWNAMVRGISPEQSADSLIKRQWVENCLFNENADPDDSYPAVGIDVANSEAGDKAALAWGRASRLEVVQEFQCDNATHLAYNLIYEDYQLSEKLYTDYSTQKLKEYDIDPAFIGIDAVGVGVATVNAFLDEGMPSVNALQGAAWDEVIPVDKETEKPKYKFRNLRAQMYWELREDLRASRINIAIVNDELRNQLVRELCIPKFDVSTGAIAIEKKESIKKRLGGKSPNLADAVVYWNWVRKGYRYNSNDALPFIGGSGLYDE